MTVSSTTDRKSYAGDDLTVAFGTSPMVFFDETDLQVFVITTATGASDQQALTTDYTVSGGAGSTGTVTMLAAPASTETLLIKRVMPYTQEAEFVNGDDNDAEVTEDAFDKLTMIVQQGAADESYPLRLSDAETPTDAKTILPFDRASKVLAFNSSKELIATESEEASALRAALAESGGSALIGTVQSGIGAIAETVEDALRRMVFSGQYSSAANFNTATDALTDTVGFKKLQFAQNSGLRYRSTGAAPFTTSAHTNTFNGTIDPTLLFAAYNISEGTAGAKIVSGEPTLFMSMEGDYNDGAAHWMEMNSDYLSADGLTDKRFFAFRVNRSTHVAEWVWSPSIRVDATEVGAGNTYILIDSTNATKIGSFRFAGGSGDELQLGSDGTAAGATKVQVGWDITGAATTYLQFASTGITFSKPFTATAANDTYAAIKTAANAGAGSSAGGWEIQAADGTRLMYFRRAGGTGEQLALVGLHSSITTMTIGGGIASAIQTINFYTDNFVKQVAITHTASANRNITLTGSNGGNPTLSVSAGDLAITPAIAAASTLTVTGAFGCNTKAAQTAFASGGALNAYGAGANGFDSGANASALHALVVKMRTALVANGIMS